MGKGKGKKSPKQMIGFLGILAAIFLVLPLRENLKQDNPQQYAETSSGEMKVAFLDVGQADCTVIIMDSGETMLVDCGDSGDYETIDKYLTEQGITRIDYLILTHPHEDHIGSASEVLRNYEVGTTILPEKVHTTWTYENMLNALAENSCKVQQAIPGECYALGEASFTILGPLTDYEDNYNNWSVGVRLVNGKNSFIMCGDAEEEAEEDMIIRWKKELQSEVLKVSHHGSSTGSCQEFLEMVSPKYAIISVGTDNEYGHPHREVLRALEEGDIQVYRTDQQGTITCISDGKKISFSTEKD